MNASWTIRTKDLACLLTQFLLFPFVLAQSPDARIAAIISELRDEQYDHALQLLDAELKLKPNDAQLWTMQGVAYEGQGKNAKALASFRQALNIAPDSVPALEKAAQLEYEAGDPKGIPLLEHLLRLQPTDLTTHGMLAVLEYQQGNCAKAVPHFEQASSLFETRLPALHAYGTCLVRLKRLDDAVYVFQKALKLDPEDEHDRLIAASVQVVAHHPNQAIETLASQLSSNQDPQSLELASAAYEELHDTDKAVDSLRQAIMLDPHNANLYVDFAALSAEHQSFQVGIDAVNDGIGVIPNAAPLYFARGVLYVQLAEYEKAQADFEKAYSLDPAQSLSAAAQGLAAVQRNDLGEALAGIKAKLANRPDDPILLYLEADVLTQQGAEPGSPEFAIALRSAKRAVQLRPSLGAAHGVLAKLYLQSGQFTEAAAECRKALENDPTDQSAVYHLIQALRKSHNNSEIPELLKQLARLRQQAAVEEREQYRFKLVENETQTK